MDLATQTHLKTIRDALEYRLRELDAEVHAAKLAQRDSASSTAREVADQKDEAAQHMQFDIDDAQEKRDLDELAQVRAALKRLDDGRYGDCADCGEPIPLQRLLAQPSALRCAPCQSAFEHARTR